MSSTASHRHEDVLKHKDSQHAVHVAEAGKLPHEAQKGPGPVSEAHEKTDAGEAGDEADKHADENGHTQVQAGGCGNGLVSCLYRPDGSPRALLCKGWHVPYILPITAVFYR